MPSKGPLDGLRVLDLTRLLPGPMCTLYLADLGADVIKVEDTGAGDYARAMDASGDKPSAFYRLVNRNKRSLSIDLKNPRGRDALLALVRTADALIEGFRPGVMANLGLDYAILETIQPRLVYVSLSGYGQSGPRALRAGHDINYLGYAGVLDQTGCRNGPPALGNVQLADLLGGAAPAAIGMLAAMIGAMRTGFGRHVDVAMADGALAHNVFTMHALQRDGTVAERGSDLLTGGVPCYGVYETGDHRWLAVGALEAKFWEALCGVVGRPDLVPLRLARGADGARARRELEAIFASATLREWLDRFGDIDACVGPVATLEEALYDPQFEARGIFVAGGDGTKQFGPPFALSNPTFRVEREPPAQGEHSVEVLREAGLSTLAIDALLAEHAILQA